MLRSAKQLKKPLLLQTTRLITTANKQKSIELIKEANKKIEDLIFESDTIRKEESKYLELYNKAGELGNPYGYLYAGRFHNWITKNKLARDNCYAKADYYSQNDGRLQYDLANCYQDAYNGKKTIQMLRKAEQNGCEYAKEKLHR